MRPMVYDLRPTARRFSNLCALANRGPETLDCGLWTVQARSRARIARSSISS
jgi:hypothetical protein